MPVVELSYERLLRLVSAGRKTTRKSLSEALPYLGLDIESDDGKTVRIEYSPNRPDYATDIGVSLGLQGILGVRRGPVPFEVAASRGAGGRGGDGSRRRDSGVTRRIAVSRTVSGIRPVLTGITAHRRGGGAIDDALLRQLVALQEDLHMGLGRGRKKVAIGLHDLSRISGGFPLKYAAVAPGTHRFVPLGCDGAEMTVPQILKDTRAGRAYGHLLSGHDRCPVILDSAGNTISMPPIINSEMTAVTTGTADLLVEVTGTSRHAAENVLAVIAVTLHAAGFDLEPVLIEGGQNRTPPFEPRIVQMSLGRANGMLGLDLSASEASLCLERCRLRPLDYKGSVDGGDVVIPCVIPPYRHDITSEVDLVEEVALGYGTWRISPVLLPPKTFGGARAEQSQIMHEIDMALVGMGYLEALNSGLTSPHVLYEMAGRPTPRQNRIISTVGSKSSEHSILRDSLLPGLVENLSRNIHEAYPQRLFETGIVFSSAGRRAATATATATTAATPPSGPRREKQQRRPGRDERNSSSSSSSDGDGAKAHPSAPRTGPIAESTRVAAVSAHADSGFSEAKSVLQTLLDAVSHGAWGKGPARTEAASHHMFADGRCARVVGADRRTLGHVGEISPRILSGYRIRVAVAGFELHVSGAPASQR